MVEIVAVDTLGMSKDTGSPGACDQPLSDDTVTLI
jgi:hypothetical protein